MLAGGDGPLFDAADAVGAKAVVLKRLDNALSLWSAVAAFREVLREMRAARPDLIHVHSAKASALGRLAGWCLRVPVIYTVHGFAFKPAVPLARRLAARLTEWCLAPLTTRLICVAQAERALAASLPIPARHIEVIRNGIPDTVLRANPGAPLRRIVMVARLKAPKRPDLLIRAFVEADIADCELIIAGEGPDMDALQTLVTRVASGRRVTLCGPVVDIPALLASAQAFSLVSDHEGLPLSILEAMRAGLPVIASDLPGIREQLDNGDGCLVPDNNVATLATAIRKVATSTELRSTLGARARARWARDFRLDRMADATWQIYQDVLAGDPSDVHAAGSEGA